MTLTDKETWAALHGMIFGALFLLAFTGALASLYSLKPALVTPAGLVERVRRVRIGALAMVLVAWATVITGTWIVYPWYRAASPLSAKSLLLASPNLAQWHTFGMEWKEHIAWLVPFLVTPAAFAIWYYGRALIRHQAVRRAVITLFTFGFASAAVAGLLGAFITKASPVH